jgi:hypothetical protein
MTTTDARKRLEEKRQQESLTGDDGKVLPPDPKTARARMWLHAHDEEIREEAYRQGYEDALAGRQR